MVKKAEKPTKICETCKWMISRQNGQRFICLNPLNDGLFDYFNASSGNVMENIRVAATVIKDGTCGHWEQQPESIT